VTATMRGIHAAFEGRLGRDAELRATKQGKPWLSFSLAVDTEGEEDALTTWVRVAYFGEDAESLSGRLQRGVEVYCEGRLKLDTWTAKDGLKRTGLSVVAWKVVPLGQIGRKRPGRSVGIQPGGFRQCA
jgi:single-strand DNA-binding protein